MPFRLNEFRSKVQFMSSAAMPSRITKAAKKRGYRSNAEYINNVLCEVLSRELDLDVDALKAELPPPAARFYKHH